MKICLAVPVRDKARTLRRTVNACLAQEGEPIEILISDQMSTDGSWEILQDYTAKYDGPHTLRIVRCPETEYRGMAGMNAHFCWMHNQSDADVFINCSADDMPLKQRAMQTRIAYEEHDPHMVLTRQFFLDEEGDKLVYAGETAHPSETGWVKYEDVFAKAIGGSTSQSWSRKFFEMIGGLQGLGSQDMVMPFVAAALGKCWYINERLHAYVKVSDLNNTGLEGVMRATQDAEELLRLEELCHMQVTCGLFTSAQKLGECGMVEPATQNALVAAIVDRAASWQRCRQKMALQRIQPRAITV